SPRRGIGSFDTDLRRAPGPGTVARLYPGRQLRTVRQPRCAVLALDDRKWGGRLDTSASHGPGRLLRTEPHGAVHGGIVRGPIRVHLGRTERRTHRSLRHAAAVR